MENSTQLILVRHAETTMISGNKIHGHLDAPLSEAGLADSRKTAEHFRGQHIDTLYASSLGRAMRTAEIIGKAVQLDPIPVDKLRERYYGRLEGKSLDRFEPDGSGPWYFRPYVNLTLYLTGEHEKDFVARVIEGTKEIIARHPNQRTMLVVHWGILGILSQYFQGLDVNAWRVIGPWTACGISEFERKDGRWQILRMNDGSHLN
jgi:broad specificity phosphatase PhoE